MAGCRGAGTRDASEAGGAHTPRRAGTTGRARRDQSARRARIRSVRQPPQGDRHAGAGHWGRRPRRGGREQPPNDDGGSISSKQRPSSDQHIRRRRVYAQEYRKATGPVAALVEGVRRWTAGDGDVCV